GSAVEPAERQIFRMVVESDGFREKLAHELAHDALHRGLECERLLDLLISSISEHPDPAMLAAALEERERRFECELLLNLLISKVGEPPDPTMLAAAPKERERPLLFEVLLEPVPEPT